MDIPRRSPSQIVVDHIRRNLDDGTWKTGDKIPSENELTKILGVSRASIRPAIQRLIGMGQLESFQGKGTFVVSTDVKHRPGSGTAEAGLEEILTYLAAVLPEAGFLAASKHGSSLAATLQAHLHRQVSAINDSEGYLSSMTAFHNAIAAASGNRLFEQGVQAALDSLLPLHRQAVNALGYKDGVYYHSVIQKAFENNNPTQAKTLLAELLAVMKY